MREGGREGGREGMRVGGREGGEGVVSQKEIYKYYEIHACCHMPGRATAPCWGCSVDVHVCTAIDGAINWHIPCPSVKCTPKLLPLAPPPDVVLPLALVLMMSDGSLGLLAPNSLYAITRKQ